MRMWKVRKAFWVCIFVSMVCVCVHVCACGVYVCVFVWCVCMHLCVCLCACVWERETEYVLLTHKFLLCAVELDVVHHLTSLKLSWSDKESDLPRNKRQDDNDSGWSRCCGRGSSWRGWGSGSKVANEAGEVGMANEVEDVGIAEKNSVFNSPTYLSSIIHVLENKDVWELYTECYHLYLFFLLFTVLICLHLLVNPFV